MTRLVARCTACGGLKGYHRKVGDTCKRDYMEPRVCSGTYQYPETTTRKRKTRKRKTTKTRRPRG